MADNNDFFIKIMQLKKVTMRILEKTSIYFAVELRLREISYILYVHLIMCMHNRCEIHAQWGCAMIKTAELYQLDYFHQKVKYSGALI